MRSLLYHAFGVKGFRYLRTRYEGGEIIFELEPEKEPEVAAGQKLRRHGYRWRTVRSMSIGLKPVILKVKVPRWLNTTTGEEFELQRAELPRVPSERRDGRREPGRRTSDRPARRRRRYDAAGHSRRTARRDAIKLMNERLDDLRRELAREAQPPWRGAGGCRWLLPSRTIRARTPRRRVGLFAPKSSASSSLSR